MLSYIPMAEDTEGGVKAFEKEKGGEDSAMSESH